MSHVAVHKLTGKAINPFLQDLARLRIEVFKEFPYLYEGSMKYEEAYLRSFAATADSVCVAAIHDGKVVGASTGMPLSGEHPEFMAPFEKIGMDTAAIFYCAESVLLPEYRGKGLGHVFFEEREAHAMLLGRFRYITFCAVERPDLHPLKPKRYRPLDSFWQKHGYEKRPDISTFFSWPDIGEKKESPKKMVYWMKSIG